MEGLECIITCLMRQGIAERCDQKYALLQHFVEHQAVMDFLEARLKEEHATIKTSHNKMEASKIVMDERVDAVDQAEQRVKGHLRDYREK